MIDARSPKPQTYNGDLAALPTALEHLREQKVWLCWRWFWNGKKWTKPPRRVDNPERNASSSDPATWGSYAEAVEQVRAGRADGIGFALKGRNIGGIDLDHCRDPATGVIDPWAEERLAQFPDAYVEATVSGKGLRILGTSSLDSFAPKFKLQTNGAAIELFSNSHHYLTLSCNALRPCAALPPIADKMTALASKLGGQTNGLDFNTASRVEPRVEHEIPYLKTPWTFAEETRLRSALAAIPTNEKALTDKFGHSHSIWIKIGRAIERLGWGNRGFSIWRDWSAQNAGEFDEGGLRTQWASFERNRGTRDNPVTIATVFYFARQFGWNDDAEDVQKDFAPADPGPFDVSDFIGSAPQRKWIVEDWIAEGVVNSLYGNGGIGKTLLAQQLAYCLRIGHPFLGIEVERKTSFCVLCEDDRQELHRRHDAISAGLGHPYDNPFKGVTVWPRVGLENLLVTWDHKNEPRLTPQFRAIWKEVLAKRPDLLVLDTLADVYGGNEIIRVQVNYFIKTVLGRLILQAKDAGFTLTVLLLAHPSLAGIASGTGTAGSTAWENAVRARLYMRRPENGHFDERELVRAKANYSSAGEETVLRMMYQAGYFVAVGPGSELALKSAKEHLRRLVSEAWNSKRPYTSKSGHSRNLHVAGLAALLNCGVNRAVALQAIREMVEDGDIWTKKRNSYQGYCCEREDDE